MKQSRNRIDAFAVPMVLLRIGWMDRYQGLIAGDEIKGGGAFVEQHGFGAEIYNFKEHQGLFYGFVEPPGRKAGDALGKRIKIERLGASAADYSISGALAIFAWSHDARRWEDQNGRRLEIEEIVAARCRA